MKWLYRITREEWALSLFLLQRLVSDWMRDGEMGDVIRQGSGHNYGIGGRVTREAIIVAEEAARARS